MAPLRAPAWRRWSVASAAVVVGACLVGLKAAAAGELVVVAAAAVNVARGIRAHRPPDALAWWLAFGALLLFLAASGVDDLEQWLYAGHVPYPSASDPISLASYLMGIAAGLAFLRHRSRRADPTRLVDAGVVTAGVAALVWAMVVVPDLQDRASTLLARGTNVVFDVLALVLLAIVVRLAVGPGARNASWYWLATAVASLLASDLALVAWSTSQGSAPLEIVTTGLATWTCASVAAAAMHPSMVRLTEPLDEDISPMTMGRVGVMVGSALVVPAIVLLEGGTSTYLSTVGVVAAWAVMSALVVVRMAGLVRARERSARIESVVRHAGSRMVGASGPDEIYRAACDGAVAALAAEGAPSAWAVVGTVCGSELMVMSAGPDPRTPVAEGMKVSVPALVDALSAGRACALEPPTGRGLPPALAAPWVGAFPVASKTAVEGVLVVGTGRPLGAAGFAGCESLARLLSLALDSSAAASLRHQKAAERRYRMLFEHAADLVAVIGRSGSVDFVSPSGSRLLGIDLQQHRIGDLRQLVHPDERSGYDRLIGEASIDGCPPVEARLRTATGWRWFDVVARDLRGVPDVAAIVVTARDITDRKLAEQRLAESERRFRSLVQSSTDIFATVEDGGRIRWASDSLHQVVGMAPGEVVGRDLASLVEEASREDVVHTLRRLQDHYAREATLTVRIPTRGGEVRIFDLSLVDLRGDDAVGSITLNARDVTDDKTLEEGLRHRALHDALTGLPNRVLLRDRLEQALSRRNRDGKVVALMFVDMDDFKGVNDRFGHAAGDDLLRQAASRLRNSCRSEDTASRLGGDEFAVLLESAASLEDVLAVGERLRQALRRPFRVGGHHVRVAASVGVALAHAPESVTPDQLLRHADTAMYAAKRAGKDRVELYRASSAGDPEMTEEKGDLLGAVDRELRVHYQPVIELASGRTIGYEALLRWQHPVRGLLPASCLLPLAEQTGLAVPIGWWTLGTALRQLAAWRHAGRHVTVAVDISARHLEAPRMVERVKELLDATATRPEELVVEVTERLAPGSVAAERIRALRDMGVRVSVDDFDLQPDDSSASLPVSAVKLGKSLVDGLSEPGAAPDRIRAIVADAHQRHLVVVAEGVERPEQADLLIDLDCDYAQGHLFGSPAPADEAATDPAHLQPGAVRVSA